MIRCDIPNESFVQLYDIVKLDDHLTFVEEPDTILTRDVRPLSSRSILVVKV